MRVRGTRADGHLLSVRCAVDSLNLISQSIATLCAPFYNASRTRVCPAPRRLTDASPCQSHVTSGSGRRLGGSREVGEWGEVRGGGRAGVGGGQEVRTSFGFSLKDGWTLGGRRREGCGERGSSDAVREVKRRNVSQRYNFCRLCKVSAVSTLITPFCRWCLELFCCLILSLIFS